MNLLPGSTQARWPDRLSVMPTWPNCFGFSKAAGSLLGPIASTNSLFSFEASQLLRYLHRGLFSKAPDPQVSSGEPDTHVGPSSTGKEVLSHDFTYPVKDTFSTLSFQGEMKLTVLSREVLPNSL